MFIRNRRLRMGLARLSILWKRRRTRRLALLLVVVVLFIFLLVSSFHTSRRKPTLPAALTAYPFFDPQLLALRLLVEKPDSDYFPAETVDILEFPPADAGPGSGNWTTDPSVIPFFQNVYVDTAAERHGLNANPRCVGNIAQDFEDMHWRDTDVAAAAQSYLARNVHMSVVTGYFEDYSRVKLALCTWLGHMPMSNVYFITDSMRVPQDGLAPSNGTRALYSFGHWFATEDWRRTTPSVAEMAEAVGGPSLRSFSESFKDSTLYKEGTKWYHRPAKWYDAQLRFFDALNVMYHRMYSLHESATAPAGVPRRFGRWFSVVDDDSFVQVQSLAAVLQYHQLVALYNHSGRLWQLLLVRSLLNRAGQLSGADAVMLPTALAADDVERLRAFLKTQDGPPASQELWQRADIASFASSDALARETSTWIAHCEDLQRRNARQEGSFLHLSGDDLMVQCRDLPSQMASLAQAFSEAYPGDEVAAVQALLANPSNFIQRMARLLTNFLTLHGPSPPTGTTSHIRAVPVNDGDVTIDHWRVLPDAVRSAATQQLFERMWQAADALLEPAWVQLYHLPPEKLYMGVRPGAGHYFNARAFYFHMMHEEARDAVPLTKFLSRVLDPTAPSSCADESVKARLPAESVRLLEAAAMADERNAAFFPTAGRSLSQDERRQLQDLDFPYVTPCIHGKLFQDLTSDIAMVQCLPALGVAQLDDTAFTGFVAYNLLRLPHGSDAPLSAENREALNARVPYRCRSRLLPRSCLLPTESLWDFMTSDHVVGWVIMHPKLELMDPSKETTARMPPTEAAFGGYRVDEAAPTEKPLRRLQKLPNAERAVYHTQLEHLRLKLYYEAIYTPTLLDEEGGPYDASVVGAKDLSFRAVAARLLDALGVTVSNRREQHWKGVVFRDNEDRFKLFLRLIRVTPGAGAPPVA